MFGITTVDSATNLLIASIIIKPLYLQNSQLDRVSAVCRRLKIRFETICARRQSAPNTAGSPDRPEAPRPVLVRYEYHHTSSGGMATFYWSDNSVSSLYVSNQADGLKLVAEILAGDGTKTW